MSTRYMASWLLTLDHIWSGVSALTLRLVPVTAKGARTGMVTQRRSLGQRLLADIAAQVGVSRAQLNRIRNGRAVPRLDTAIALAQCLGCRVSELFYLRSRRSRRG